MSEPYLESCPGCGRGVMCAGAYCTDKCARKNMIKKLERANRKAAFKSTLTRTLLRLPWPPPRWARSALYFISGAISLVVFASVLSLALDGLYERSDCPTIWFALNIPESSCMPMRLFVGKVLLSLSGAIGVLRGLNSALQNHLIPGCRRMINRIRAEESEVRS
jgi:hypothetical protein